MYGVSLLADLLKSNEDRVIGRRLVEFVPDRERPAVEALLRQALKEVRRGKDQGLDSKTFSAVLRDKAKAG